MSGFNRETAPPVTGVAGGGEALAVGETASEIDPDEDEDVLEDEEEDDAGIAPV